MRMPSVEVVSFDMNGTLTQNHFVEAIWGEAVPRLYSQARGLSLEESKVEVYAEYDKVGERRVEWYDIKYWFRSLGLGDDWRALLESLQHHVRPYSDASYVLQQLGRRHRLVVTSNASAEFIEFELGAARLREYFDSVFSCTSDFGEVKKTPDVYSRVCSTVGIEPEHMIHIGDHLDFDYLAPRELGIRAFYLDRNASGRTEDFVVRSLTEFLDRIASV